MEKENPFCGETIIYTAEIDSHEIKQLSLKEFAYNENVEVIDGKCIKHYQNHPDNDVSGYRGINPANAWEAAYHYCVDKLRFENYHTIEYASFDLNEVQEWVNFNAHYNLSDEEIQQGKNAERLRRILENNPANKE